MNKGRVLTILYTLAAIVALHFWSTTKWNLAFDISISRNVNKVDELPAQFDILPNLGKNLE